MSASNRDGDDVVKRPRRHSHVLPNRVSANSGALAEVARVTREIRNVLIIRVFILLRVPAPNLCKESFAENCRI
jgi:hypothetical protein